MAVGLGVVLIAVVGAECLRMPSASTFAMVPAWGVWPAPVMTMPPLR